MASSDRSDDIVAVVNDLRARMARMEALGAARWGSPNIAGPLGVVASASSTSDQTGITTTTDITFATATWTAATNRLYRITLQVATLQVTSTGQQSVLIVTNASGTGTQLSGATIPGIVATGLGLQSMVTFQTGNGLISVHARANTSAGTLTISNTTSKGWFVVEDVGPV